MKKKVKEVLQITNLENFEKNLKFGLNTVLGEQGARISGGQKTKNWNCTSIIF